MRPLHPLRGWGAYLPRFRIAALLAAVGADSPRYLPECASRVAPELEGKGPFRERGVLCPTRWPAGSPRYLPECASRGGECRRRELLASEGGAPELEGKGPFRERGVLCPTR